MMSVSPTGSRLLMRDDSSLMRVVVYIVFNWLLGLLSFYMCRHTMISIWKEEAIMQTPNPTMTTTTTMMIQPNQRMNECR